jgi:hypothetical protein
MRTIPKDLALVAIIMGLECCHEITKEERMS